MISGGLTNNDVRMLRLGVLRSVGFAFDAIGMPAAYLPNDSFLKTNELAVFVPQKYH